MIDVDLMFRSLRLAWMLEFFKELKAIYGYDQGSDLVLFNNREILVDNKTVYLNNWVENDVISIKDLLKETF